MGHIDDYDLIDKDWDLFIKKGLEAFQIDAETVLKDDQRDWNTRVIECAEGLCRAASEVGNERVSR